MHSSLHHDLRKYLAAVVQSLQECTCTQALGSTMLHASNASSDAICITNVVQGECNKVVLCYSGLAITYRAGSANAVATCRLVVRALHCVKNGRTGMVGQVSYTCAQSSRIALVSKDAPLMTSQ